jgi:hypothetical protein
MSWIASDTTSIGLEISRDRHVAVAQPFHAAEA